MLKRKKPTNVQFFTECGHRMDENIEFCPQCGHKAEKLKTESVEIESSKKKHHWIRSIIIAFLILSSIGFIGQAADEAQTKKDAEQKQQQIAEEQKRIKEDELAKQALAEQQAKEQARANAKKKSTANNNPAPQSTPDSTPDPEPAPAPSNPLSGDWSGNFVVTGGACSGASGSWTAEVDEAGQTTGSYIDSSGYVSGDFSGLVNGTTWNVSGGGGSVSFVGTVSNSSVSGNFTGPACPYGGGTSGTFSGSKS